MRASSGLIRKWTTKEADNSSLVLIGKDLQEVYLRAKFLRPSSILSTSQNTDRWMMYTHRKRELLVSLLASQNNKLAIN